jgi:hypothetical protein
VGRDIGAIVAGLASWWLVAAVGYWLLAAVSEDYALAEPSADFTGPMLLARLLVGIVCSIVAGALCGGIAGPDSVAPAIVGGLMLILLVPIQYAVWTDFPNWYHVVFLGHVVPVIWRSAKVASRPKNHCQGELWERL